MASCRSAGFDAPMLDSFFSPKSLGSAHPTPLMTIALHKLMGDVTDSMSHFL